jgi:hypothetical protein
VPLSAAEKQRRYRERKQAEVEARARYDRGLPEPEPEPEAPEGAYLTSNGHPRPKYDHYERINGTFAPLPDDLRGGHQQAHAQYEARRREGEDIAGRATPIYEAWKGESVTMKCDES